MIDVASIRFYGGIPDVDSMVEALCVLLQQAKTLTRDQAGNALVLWWNPLHRQHLLGRWREPDGMMQSVGSIPQIVGRAILDGHVSQDADGNLALLRDSIYGTEVSRQIAKDVLQVVL